MRDFEGKVAVVTGAASGMGRAFAERFAAEGMKVVLADVEAPPLDTAVSELRQAEHDVLGVLTDVSKRESVAELARQAVDTYGKVHLLCNNAGVDGFLGTIWEATRARLAVDLRRQLLGHRPRRRGLLAWHAGPRRRGAHRQYRVGDGSSAR